MVKIKKIGISIIAASFLLSGCVGGITKKEISIPPQWYLIPQNNTSQFLYGEGEGNNLEEAKTNSLNNMAASLIIAVSSTMQTTTKTTNSEGKNNYSKDISKNVKLEVQKIKFSNAIIKNSEMINGRFYNLMQVNRTELFEQQKGEFDSKDARSDQLINSIEGKNKIDQIHILQDMHPLLKEVKAQIIILNAINNNFPYSTYLKKYDNYIDKLDDIKNNCIISIKTNQADQYFSDNLIDLLNQNKYKISNNNDNDIEILITNSPKYSLADGWNIVKVSTTLSVISNGKIVSNKIIYSIGRSSTSKESALEDASKKFREEILNQTIDKIIFAK